MKVTKEYLKQLILEELQEQEQQPARNAPTDEKEDDKNTELSTQELKNRIIGTARELSGIMRNELDIVNFALAVLNAAKNKNLNSGVLRQKLELVKSEMEKIK